MIGRYWRAFVVALRYTLRGEKPPLLRIRDQYPVITAWLDQTVALVTQIEREAAAAGIDTKTFTVRADRRDVSMATILAAVKFHAQREYPSLMVHNDRYSPITVHATNLNDRYLVMQLADKLKPPIQSIIKTLADHLAQMPE